jgi:rRNA maturation endonuclease Nob1
MKGEKMDINILIKKLEKNLKNTSNNIIDFSESGNAEMINAVPTYRVREMELQLELEALKKQVPMYVEADYKLDYDPCPNCKEPIIKLFKFCPNCGQKLKWN